MNRIDLKEIQRKLTPSYFEDGIMIVPGGIIPFIGFGVLVRFNQQYPQVNLPEV